MTATAPQTLPAGRAADNEGFAAPLATLAITLVSVAATVAMCRVFADWSFLRPMLTVVILTHAVAWLMRLGRVTGWIAVPFGVLAICVLIGLVYYSGTTSFGLPGRATLEAFRSDLRLVWQQFPTAVAPVPSDGNFAVIGGAALAVCALIADAFAFRALGRAEAVVPTGVVVVFVAALGADRSRIAATAFWLAAAVVAVAALRNQHRAADSAWMGPKPRTTAGAVAIGALCAGCVSVGAAALAPRLPGAGQEALLDTRNRAGDVTQVVSPLVDIRSNLVNRSNSLFFTVSSPSPHYWRLISLSDFNGKQWRPSEQELRSAAEGLGSAHPQAEIIDYTVTIARMRGTLLPAVYSPTQIAGSGVNWAVGNEALVAEDELQRDEVFTIQSAVLRPTPDQLRGASTANPPDAEAFDLPDGLPSQVADTARQVTADAATPYDQALALQNWFHSEFDYTLQVQRGHSNDAISDFLENRRGYCEQFAGTFAAMARTLGIPARVVVGFTPGETDGSGVYRVYGRQAHAWAEVWFDGLGWVQFDPTPGRGSPDAQEHTGLPAAQQEGATTNEGVSESPDEGELPNLPATPTTQLRDGVPRSTNVVPASTVPRPVSKADSSSVSDHPRVWGLVAVLGLAGLWLLLAPRLAAFRHRRGHRPPSERIEHDWRRAVEHLARAGVEQPDGVTPAEFAKVAVRHGAGNPSTVSRLADLVTVAAYSPSEPDDDDADEADQLTDEISEWCEQTAPITQRLKDRALLRL
jgi:transglutaminase-like putative cysteine protease